MSKEVLTNIQSFLSDQIIDKAVQPNYEITEENRFFELTYAIQNSIITNIQCFKNEDVQFVIEKANHILDGTSDSFKRCGIVMALLLLLLNFNDVEAIRELNRSLTQKISLEILSNI